MAQHYHPGLVVVSLVVAILASYTALTLALRIRAGGRASGPAWLAGGGFAMGVGIWAMHFVGMLAMSLPVEIGYDVPLTLYSLLIAIVVSTFALHIASRPRVARASLTAAGIAMGIGICSMHYVGMAAIEMSPPIRYDPRWVVASFAIAIAASFAALWVVFSPAEGRGWRRYRKAWGAVVMGLAIAGMHYAGMVAAHFPAEGASGSASLVNKAWLAGAVTTMTLFVLFAALLLSLLELRAARMQASLALATESNRAKDEFLAMLGHELRNPLAAIASSVHLLDRAEPRSREWQLARDVLGRQSSHLAKIVDDLLEVGRALTGKMAMNPEPLDLQAAVKQALAALDAAGRTRGRRVEFRGEQAWIQADPTRIEQAVTNLVSNAVQHTAEGGRISLGLHKEGGEAVLSVSDDGAGMDAETAARAFDLFYQAPQGPHRGRGGMGIGLTLTQRIAQMHGGRIAGASPGPGRGSTFTMRLPLIAPPAGSQPLPATAPAGSRRVVIVEDSDDARLSLQTLLEKEGHQVRSAADGPGGVQAILEFNPDIALIDIGLPGADGYEVARRVRKAGGRACLVALTGYGLSEDRELAAQAGFDLHLTKPPDLPHLLQLVQGGGGRSGDA